MSLIDKIAENIKRIKGKMTFIELSKKSGVPYNTLEKIVFTKEIKEPRISTLQKIAKTLKVRFDDLLK